MADESGTTERNINIQVAANTATPCELRELVDGVTAKVGEAVQTWQEQMQARKAAKTAAPVVPQCAGR